VQFKVWQLAQTDKRIISALTSLDFFSLPQNKPRQPPIPMQAAANRYSDEENKSNDEDRRD